VRHSLCRQPVACAGQKAKKKRGGSRNKRQKRKKASGNSEIGKNKKRGDGEDRIFKEKPN